MGLSAAEEGRAARAATPPILPLPCPTALAGEGEGGKGEGDGGVQEPLSVSLVWRAVKQVVMGRALNVLLLTLPFGGLSGTACVFWGGGLIDFVVRGWREEEPTCLCLP